MASQMHLQQRMLNLAKILLPTDFSARSKIAAQEAGMLARRLHSELTLLHVNNGVSLTHAAALGARAGSSASSAPIDERTAAARAELNTFAIKELEGIPVKRLICSGDPAKVIVEYAQTEHVDLIFIPTRGNGPFRQFLLGSVTAKVLHDAECPVWTGAHLEGQGALDPTHVRHVICAVDFGPQSAKALHWAADYAAEFGAKLTVAHAVFPTALPERYTFQWHEEARTEADDRLQTLLSHTGVRADALVIRGDTPKALCTAIQEKGAALLVIGRRAVSGKQGRLGSDAYGIICHSTCPVISI
jgi:nucleotide-binding universal stress UspA family protein